MHSVVMYFVFAFDQPSAQMFKSLSFASYTPTRVFGSLNGSKR